MTPAEWSALIAESVIVQADTGYRAWTEDVLTGQTLCFDLPIAISNYSYSKVNGYGELSGDISLDASDDVALLTEPRRTRLWVQHRGRLVWGGIIWDAEPQIAARTLRITAQTSLSYYEMRLLSVTLSFVDRDQLEIFRGLIVYADAQLNGDIGLQFEETLTGIRRTRYYGPGAGEGARPDKPILEAMKQLAELDNGFEFVDDWFWNDDSQPQSIVRFGYPTLGSTGGVAGLTWEYPGNCLDYTWTVAGKNSPNFMVAPGAGEGALMLVGQATNEDEMTAGYPRLSASTGGEYKDVVQKATLLGHAAEDLAAVTGGRVAPQLTVRTDVDPLPNTYGAGDRIRFRATSAYHRAKPDGSPGLDILLRITGITVTPERPDQAGKAVLTTMRADIPALSRG